LLLDQRVVAGIGNIYKSEALFAAGVDPRTPVAAIDPAALEAIYRHASAIMAATLPKQPGGPVQSQTDGGFQVYSRTGKPCPRCGARIACYALGEPPRWTWSCPACQPVPSGYPSGRG
jgi:endonuclease-8